MFMKIVSERGGAPAPRISTPIITKTKHFSNMLARPKANLIEHANLAA
jgi:hypothetical protein